MTTVRRATTQDAAELTRLREILLRELGQDVTVSGWRDNTFAAFTTRLGPGGDMAAFVVDAEPSAEGRLAACAVGFVFHSLPGPTRPDGRTGYVLNLSTDPAHRGRGYARANTAALLDWFHGDGVRRVEMYAAPQGEPLARSLGFTEYSSKALTWATSPPV